MRALFRLRSLQSMLAQLTIHGMGIKFWGLSSECEGWKLYWKGVDVLPYYCDINNAWNEHCARVSSFKLSATKSPWELCLPSKFPREGLATDSENNFKNPPPLTQFPRCRNSPQSNKYLINQSRIFSLFRYPFFKYSSDLYRLSREHQNINHSVITSYLLTFVLASWWCFTTFYFRISRGPDPFRSNSSPSPLREAWEEILRGALRDVRMEHHFSFGKWKFIELLERCFHCASSCCI